MKICYTEIVGLGGQVMNMNVVRNNSSKRMNVINMNAYGKLVAFSDSSTANSSNISNTYVNLNHIGCDETGF